MTTTPPQPPEGALIEAARKRRVPKTSIKEFGEKIGLSYSRWRQIELGYQTPRAGQHVEVHAPHDTLARMAFAVGVTADQLRAAGRGDAADFLESTLGIGDNPTPVEVHDLSQDPDWRDLELVVAGTPPEVRAIGLKITMDTFKRLNEGRDELARTDETPATEDD